MKKASSLLVFLSLSVIVLAQYDTTAPYKRFPTIPPVQLLLVDNTNFTKADLKKNQPLILMYFSPECDHCQHQVNDMLKRIKDLKKYQIVMATSKSFEEMKAFYDKYKLAAYSNIVMGRDIKYLLPPFFRMRNLPYLALYDKKGNLITSFDGNVKVDSLISAFK